MLHAPPFRSPPPLASPTPIPRALAHHDEHVPETLWWSEIRAARAGTRTTNGGHDPEDPIGGGAAGKEVGTSAKENYHGNHRSQGENKRGGVMVWGLE